MNNKLLKESFMEERLKKYFRYMENVYGEEVALNTALTDYSFRSSIAKFSEDFYDYSDLDVNTEILKTCILTDKPEDTALKYANTLIANDRISQLLIDIETNKILQIALIENYLRNMYSTSIELYNKAKSNQKYRIIDRDLENLNKFKERQETSVKENISKNEKQTLVKSYETIQTPVLVGEQKRRRLG